MYCQIMTISLVHEYCRYNILKKVLIYFIGSKSKKTSNPFKTVHPRKIFFFFVSIKVHATNNGGIIRRKLIVIIDVFRYFRTFRICIETALPL